MAWAHPQQSFPSPTRTGRSSRNLCTTTLHSSGESKSQGAPRLPRVHDRIDVFWEECDCAFRGTIVKATRDSGTRFLIQYDDGDLLHQDLDLQRWRFVFPHETARASPSDANDTLVGADRNTLSGENVYDNNDKCHYSSQEWFEFGDLGELLRDHQDSTFNATGHSTAEPRSSQRAKRQRTGPNVKCEHRNSRQRQHRYVNPEHLTKLPISASIPKDNLDPCKSGSVVRNASVGTEQNLRYHKNRTAPTHSHNRLSTTLPPTSPASHTHAVSAPSLPPLMLQLQLRTPRGVNGNEIAVEKGNVAFLSTKSPRCLDQFPNVRLGRLSNTPAFTVNHSEKEVVTHPLRSHPFNECSFKKYMGENGNDDLFNNCADNRVCNINNQEIIAAGSHSFMLEQCDQNSHGPKDGNVWKTVKESGRNGSDESGISFDQPSLYERAAINGSVAFHKRKDYDGEHSSPEVMHDPELWEKFRDEVVPLRKRLYRPSRGAC